jgi:hypothetical protein
LRIQGGELLLRGGVEFAPDATQLLSQLRGTTWSVLKQHSKDATRNRIEVAREDIAVQTKCF